VLPSAVNPLSADFQANASEMNRLVEQLRSTLQTVHKGKLDDICWQNIWHLSLILFTTSNLPA
jgi:hypothetical protein